MVKIVSKALKITSNVLIGLYAILALLLVGMRLFGFEIYTVLSPSMKPTYPPGSIIYVSEVDTADLEVNDVINFQFTDTMTATHRIIEIVPDENDPERLQFRTKGDNNSDDDGLISSDRVLGKVVFGIPLLGFVADYIQSTSGIYLAIAVAAGIMLLSILSDVINPDKKKEKNEEEPS